MMQTKNSIVWLLAMVLVTFGADSAPAQKPVDRISAQKAALSRLPVQADSRSGLSAFALDALGASLGSAAGLGLVSALRSDECDAEDLTCNMGSAAAGVAVGTAGAALGDYLTGRLFDTRPSGLCATIGAIAGAAAGLGVWHLVTEDLDIMSKSGGAVLTYSVTQGVVTALGSRLIGKR